MTKLRLRYSKTGVAKYISHLDLMRVWQRALRRAALPVCYSEGFNPHIKMSIPLPLPVGVESLCEALDLNLAEQPNLAQAVGVLNNVLPSGVRALTCEVCPVNFAPLTSCEYAFGIESSLPDDMLNALFSRPALVEKTAKVKGRKQVVTKDISPEVTRFTVSGGYGILVCEAGLSPVLAHSAAKSLDPNVKMNFTRTKAW